MGQVALKIYGMDCAEEVSVLKKEFSSVAGIQSLDFDVLNGKMTVSFDEGQTNSGELIKAVGRTGMRAEFYGNKKSAEETLPFWQSWGKTILTSLSGVCLGSGFVIIVILNGFLSAISEDKAGIPPIAKAFFLLSTLLGTWFVLPKAWLSLKRFRPDMNLLMTIAVLGAIVIGELFEAATVSFLFALSLALESWSVSRARNAIAALMELTPLTARVIDSQGLETEIDASEVQIGTKILVRPGEKIPLDGKIVAGTTSVNQAPITGESLPVNKNIGDEVFAGSINEEGAIDIETTKISSESTLSKIIKLVEDAQSKRSASEQWVEKFARYYTPLIMILALIVAVIPPLVFGASWGKWFYEALVLLVIACPCALVISTPVSIVSALVAAAKNGVLVKGGSFLEIAAHLRVIAMDKTGTLTQGKPEVDVLVPLSGHTEVELLTIAAAIEKRSEHPLAQAIVKYANARNINPSAVENYSAVKGKGATALLNGQPVWVGSHRYLEEMGKETPEMHSKLEELSSGGRSVVVIGEKDHVCGFITLSDKVRVDALATIQQLHDIGIEKIIMLTGDNKPTAEAIAKLTGVDELRAELLPEDKVSVIEELVSKYQNVAMVGDGVNDAPALARSNLGIAMGAGGTDAALETADVALMRDELSRLPWLISHAKRTLVIIRFNIFLSLGVKALFMLLTFLGHASLWMAIAADMGVSLIVVANALRLIR